MKIKMRCTRGDYRTGQEYDLPQPQAKAMVDYGVAVYVKASPKKAAAPKPKPSRKKAQRRNFGFEEQDVAE